ncbi:MAG: PAS domain-containing protein [Candidatus Omnitrophica bacterium]|nr:PAS domain-containing protein [Candidatus Omnitrophota bacterium]
MIDNVPLLVGVGVDISDRTKAEASVEASERRLADLMANLPGMAYRCKNEREWPMFFVSNGCLLLTGYKKQDFESSGIIYNDLIHPNDRDRIWHAVQEALARKDSFEFTYRVRTKALCLI